MGDWKLTPSEVLKLRDYLLRGGFLMLDDFLGYTEEMGAFLRNHGEGFSGPAHC